MLTVGRVRVHDRTEGVAQMPSGQHDLVPRHRACLNQRLERPAFPTSLTWRARPPLLVAIASPDHLVLRMLAESWVDLYDSISGLLELPSHDLASDHPRHDWCFRILRLLTGFSAHPEVILRAEESLDHVLDGENTNHHEDLEDQGPPSSAPLFFAQHPRWWGALST